MSQPYSEAFYSDQEAGSVRSAERVVPLVRAAFQVRSVIDVGCGVGGWLAAFARDGIEDVIGVDGDYVPRDALKIDPTRFLPRDLQTFDGLDRRFDLACSLEVAEHLPPSCASRFVGALVACAPVVLFSAAIPGQGGTNHLNERWQSYWAGLFAEHDYLCLDLVRPRIFDDEEVEFWYRQNTLVFCEPDRLPSGMRPIGSTFDLDRVHPRLHERMSAGPQTGREAAGLIVENVRYLGGAIGRRVGLN